MCKNVSYDKRIKYTINDVRKFFEDNGGKLLSDNYKNSHSKIKVVCKNGHVYEDTFGHLKERWCYICKSIDRKEKNKKETFNRIINMAINKGGKLVFGEFNSVKSKVILECEHGHQWETTFNRIQKGTWCKKCSIKKLANKLKKYSYTDVVNFISNKNGILLSKHYENTRQKLEVKCSEGHTWKVNFRDLLYGRWCRKCSGSQKYSYEEVKQFINNKGGYCLTNKCEYKNSKEKIEIKCQKDHIWETTFSVIKKGHWCPFCGGTSKHSYDYVRKYISNKGGILLSKEYTNNASRLEVQCEQNHIWDTYFASIQQGNWCPKCRNQRTSDRQKFSIKHVSDIINKRGYKLLSKEYNKCIEKLQIQCKNNHIWNVSFAKFQKHDCPHCKNSTEEKCRKVLNNILNTKFIKIRPKWLKNPKTGYPLELDGYSSELNLAFEHNGLQHYEITKFSNSLEILHTIQYRDTIKQEMCDKLGLKLLIFENFERFTENVIEENIKNILLQEGLLPKNDENK